MTIAAEHPTTVTHDLPIARRNPLRSLFSGLGDRPIDRIEQDWRVLGDCYAIQIGKIQIPVFSNPHYAEEVLIKQRDIFQKPGLARGGDTLALVLGNGLLTNADTDSWLTQRRMMQPMFHRKRLAAMSDQMVAAGDRMLTRWAAYAPGTTVDVSHEMMKVTLDIVTATMFSTDVLDRASEVGEAVNVSLHFAFGRRFGLRMPLDWPTPANRRFRAARATMDGLIYRMIDGRRGHEAAYDDLLSMLLEARDADTGEGMTREQLRDEAATIFGAGHETTSHALTWTLYLLAQNRPVLAQLQAEVDRVLAGRLPTFDDLPNLPYTRMVFDESMRLYPPAPLVPRYIMQPTTVDGYAIPQGAVGLLSIWNIHRHPAFWDNPLAFEPERFSDERSKDRHRMAYMPFGGGQRMCIGNNFAQIEGQLLLALIAQHAQFDLIADHVVEKDFAVTLRPKGGLPMRYMPRQV